jgi:iron complex outermembrane receptor protein
MRHLPYLLICLSTVLLAWADLARAEETSPRPANATVMKELVVTATRTEKKVDEAPASVTVITAEDIQKYNYKTLDETLKREAGIYVRRARGIIEGSPTLVMRGLYGTSRTLVMVDGQPVQNGYSGAPQWSTVPMDSVERIEVVKGPGSALYGGNAMGGVVNIITKAPQNRTFTAKGGIGTDDTYGYGFSAGDRFMDAFSLSATFEGQETGGYPTQLVTKSLPGTLGASRQTGGYGALSSTGGQVWVVGDTGDNWAKQRTGSIKAGTNSTELGALNLLASFNRHEYGYTEPNSYLDNGNFTGRTSVGGGRYTTLAQNNFISGTGIGQTDTSTLGLDYQRLVGDVNLKAKLLFQDFDKWSTQASSTSTMGYYSATGALTNQFSNTLNTDLQADIPLFDKHVLTLGSSWRGDALKRQSYNLSDYRSETSIVGDKIDQQTGKANTYGLYAQYEWPVLDSLTVYAGVRFDYWEVYDQYSSNRTSASHTNAVSDADTSPKLAAVWHALEDTYIRGSVAHAFRAPTIYQLLSPWKTTTTTTIPNPDLKPETVWNYELGGDQYFLDRDLRLSGAVFHTDLSNAMSSSTVNNINTQFNIEEATIDGYELEARFVPLSWLTLWTNYTYQYAVTRKNNNNPATEGKRMTYVPEEMANLGTELRYGWAALNVAGSYTGRMFSQDSNADQIMDVPGGYSRLWLWDAKLTLTPIEHATLSFSVDNIFDETYYVGPYVGRPRSVYSEVKVEF